MRKSAFIYQSDSTDVSLEGLFKKKKKFGTGDCGEPLPGAVAEMLNNAPNSEKNILARAYSAANQGKPFPNKASKVAFAAYGGRDCKVTTKSGKKFKRKFDELMDKYGPGGSMVQAETTNSGNNNGGGNNGNNQNEDDNDNAAGNMDNIILIGGGSLLAVTILYLAIK